MNDYNVGPGEYNFFYLNEENKVEQFTSTVGYGVRAKAVKDAPTLRDPKKYKTFLYMMKVDDESYAYLGSNNYDCVCLDRNGNLMLQKHMFTPGDISGIIFEYCRYSDGNIYKVMKVTDSITGIEIKGLKEPVLKKGEYEVYYLGEDNEPIVMDYEIDQDKPCSFIISLLENDVLHRDIMCFVDKKTKDMFMGEADYRVDYVDCDGKEEWAIVQSCRGDKIEEIIIDIYMSIYYSFKDRCNGIKEIKSLKFLGDDYKKSIFPVRKELLSFENIKPFVGEFEMEYEKELKQLDDEYRKEIERNNK